MTISVVIPVFNEEQVIGECLDLLAAQSDHLHEVIVVDNRSTDSTVDIVRQKEGLFTSLRVIEELSPGVIPARNRGLDAATGTILARIDADTRVQPGWANAVAEFFDQVGDEYGAAMGPFTQYDMPLQGLHAIVMKLAAGSSGHNDRYSDAFGVYGANMALRRGTWERIRSHLHDEPNLWEDLDISLVLKSLGIRCALVSHMRVEVSGRRMLTSRKLYWEFTRANQRTWYVNGHRSRWMWVRIWIPRILYLLFWVPSRTYDPTTRTHHARRLFARREDRPIA